MSNVIKKIKDRLGNYIFPVTVGTAVQLSDGTTAESSLKAVDYNNTTVMVNGSVVMYESRSNLANGKTYTYSVTPQHANGDASMKELTDGNKAISTDYNENPYIGWSSNFAVTLDLGAVFSIDEVIIGGLNNPTNAITIPTTIVVSGSTDNATFTTIATKTNSSSTSNFRYDNSITFARTNVRYVKLTVTLNTQWCFLDEVQVMGYTVSTVIPTQEAWKTPTLLNSWVNFDPTTNETAGYMKSSTGFVSLKGLVKSGTIGATAFTLPVGYRPLLKKLFIIQSGINNGVGTLAINTNGNVDIMGGSNAWASLDGIIFKAEQ